MTSDNIEYQKALETIGNTYPPARGFLEDTTVSSQGDKYLLTQNNLIIELLIQINRKLDLLLSTPIPQPHLDDLLIQLNQNIGNLTIAKKQKTSQQLAVWKDPKTLFQKT